MYGLWLLTVIAFGFSALAEFNFTKLPEQIIIGRVYELEWTGAADAVRHLSQLMALHSNFHRLKSTSKRTHQHHHGEHTSTEVVSQYCLWVMCIAFAHLC